jgi:hypothetical protein
MLPQTWIYSVVSKIYRYRYPTARARERERIQPYARDVVDEKI